MYALASSRWRHELTIGDEQEPVALAAIATAGDTVFAGTLGQGLWRDDGTGWHALEGALPGSFITALQVVGDTLWIGTIDLGLVSLDLASGAVRSFDEINPGLGPQNVTAIEPGADRALWITTFGAGVYRWQPEATALRTSARPAVSFRTTGCFQVPWATTACTSARSAAALRTTRSRAAPGR